LNSSEAKEIVRDLDEPATFGLEALDAFQGAALAIVLGIPKILGQELEVQTEGAQVVLDLMDEAACQLSQLGVALGDHGNPRDRLLRIATRFVAATGTG
jgi:hypothetical protein